MSKQKLEQLISEALETLQKKNELPEGPFSITVESTKDKQFGDYACNIALTLAKAAKSKPRDLAEKIIKVLPASKIIDKVEIAGPGFINFFLTANALHNIIPEILSAKENYGHARTRKNKRILVEFVSSNPTGPLHVGHGRHAAFGAVVSDLLKVAGYDVHREYYVNDAGRQMDILAVSVFLRYLSLLDEKIIFPANGYQGDYVKTIAQTVKEKQGQAFHLSAEILFADLPPDEPQGGDKEIYIDALIACAKEKLGQEKYDLIFDMSLKNILQDIHDDLKEFGVYFDQWFSEKELTTSDVVDRMIETLKQKELVYEKEGALWFRSTNFSDEKDRVLQRSNGQRTYFANDLAYHVNKFERGFDFAIDIFGSDHHGYIPRMKSGLQAFDVMPDKLTYLLLQFVSLYRHGQPVPMSTRSGSFITLRELRQEVGNDAARFFYVMRKAEQPIDFDLDLAKSKSNENPVYYIQYAHARICSVFRQLGEKAEKNGSYIESEGLSHLDLLVAPHEVDLIHRLSIYPDIILRAAENHEPHLLTNYLRDVATDFHTYYNSQQFLVEDSHLRNARLALVSAARQVIVNGLKLLGVSAPESM